MCSFAALFLPFSASRWPLFVSISLSLSLASRWPGPISFCASFRSCSFLWSLAALWPLSGLSWASPGLSLTLVMPLLGLSDLSCAHSLALQLAVRRGHRHTLVHCSNVPLAATVTPVHPLRRCLAGAAGPVTGHLAPLGAPVAAGPQRFPFGSFGVTVLS